MLAAQALQSLHVAKALPFLLPTSAKDFDGCDLSVDGL